MRHVAWHHGEPAWPEPCRRMIGHLGQDGAADDDQLLFSSMRMPRDTHSGGAFKIHVEGPAFGSPVSSADDRHFTSLSGENCTDRSGITMLVNELAARVVPLGECSDACHQCQIDLLFHTPLQICPTVPKDRSVTFELTTGRVRER